MNGKSPELLDPCAKSASCLAEKFKALAPLSPDQESLLADLETNRQTLKAGDVVFEAGGSTKDLHVLKKGWIVSESYDEFAKRSIIRVHHPGDIVGASQISYSEAPYRAVARSECIICPFPRDHLDDMLARSPRLGGLMLAVAMIETAEQEDRASVFRRNSAPARLALFVQQTFARLKLMNGLLHDRFHCPLTQSDIGDAVGLTSVHVSRTFSKLEAEGALKRHGAFIEVFDRDKLTAYSNFKNRYEALDLGWLPKN